MIIATSTTMIRLTAHGGDTVEATGDETCNDKADGTYGDDDDETGTRGTVSKNLVSTKGNDMCVGVEPPSLLINKWRRCTMCADRVFVGSRFF